MIKKVNNQFCVFDSSGEKKIACHDTEEEAKKQLAAIESNKKEFRFASGGIISVKEYDEDNLIVKGYIATTHPDAVKDIITKEALEAWKEDINSGVPRANKVTYHHDRNDVRVVGVGIKGTARVDELPDGHYGLYVETIVNKSHELYDDIKYEYKIGALDSFSIEYVHEGGSKEGSGRVLDCGNTHLYGWTLASRPVNDKAVMIKELIERKSNSLNRSSEGNGLEETNMSEEDNKQKDVLSEAERKELQELKEYKKKMDEENKAKEEADKKKKIEEEKKKQDAESKEALKKEVLAELLESKEFTEALDSKAEKPKMENKEQSEISVEVKELRRVLEDKEASPSRKILAATNFALSKGLKEASYKVEELAAVGSKSFNHVVADGTKFIVEKKSLGLDSNLSPADSAALEGGHQHADLREALDAAIINLLNDNVSYYDFVRKVNKAGSGSDRALFIVRNGRNPTAGAYTGNSVSTGKGNRRKFGTAFKKYQVGVVVDGDMIAANRGAPQGDVLATEIEFATLDLKKEINTDAYTEQGSESGAKIIGLEFVADGEGNGTLYGETRSSDNGLKYATADADKSYADGSSGNLKTNLRTMVRNILVDGGDQRGIKIFMSPLQYQRLVEGEENALRYGLNPTQVGIGGPLKLDGKYDIISDVDCPDAKVFIVDMSSVEMQFWVPPTFEPLGKRSDSEEGFIKTYVAHCFKAPRRVTMLHSVPTTL